MAAGHEFLTAPPFREAAADALHPEIRRWFAATYDEPTPAQRHAWPTIARGKNFLLSSPTGSGKTLAAFAPILSAIATSPVDGCKCLYLAPLKALCRDVGVNLKRAWHSIQTAGFCPHIHLRVGLRTGDTSQQVRRRHLRHSPTILLTTPESLAQMLAHGPSHEMLRSVRWLVLDEIHALVGTKRGADVALGMERLQAIAPAEIQRIGLSATCAPLATAADFLVGVDRAAAIASVPDIVEKQFAIEPLFENLDYSPGWINALLDRLERDLHANATTLIFTNTRNLAERVTWGLRRRHPLRLEQIAVHHSAISPARRRAVERRLKYGRLWVVVSSTSLELGIDVGAVDQVVFVQKLQTESGGFKPNDDKGDIKVLPSLRATSSAVRTLRYLGGDVPNRAGAIKFVESCWDEKAGAFTDRPTAAPEVFSTSVGLMAVVELKLSREKYVGPAVKYLSDHANTFEDIRIAVAGLESVNEKSPKREEWLATIKKLQNRGGSFGDGPGQARDTGGAVVAMLRLDVPAPKRETILKLLDHGQHQNGGWGKKDADIDSDLETSYRVMRCYHMMKARPGNVEGIRSFIAKCRNADGGYGVAPGQQSSVSGTYFAAIILHWLKE